MQIYTIKNESVTRIFILVGYSVLTDKKRILIVAT